MQIIHALDALDARATSPLLVRAYTAFSDERGPGFSDIMTPRDVSQLVVGGRQLDLVAQYRSHTADVDGYARFVRGLVRRHGAAPEPAAQ